MKTLYIVRHAKSSWENSALEDFERPLNERGKKDAPRMGKRLKEKMITVDVMLSSPAKRAYSTAKRMGEVFGISKDKITTDERLYHASEDRIMIVLHEIKNKYNTVMIFGHNPGLTDFVNMLMNEGPVIDNIPTCGVVAFQIPTEKWTDLKPSSGKMLFFDYPKSKQD